MVDVGGQVSNYAHNTIEVDSTYYVTSHSWLSRRMHVLIKLNDQGDTIWTKLHGTYPYEYESHFIFLTKDSTIGLVGIRYDSTTIPPNFYYLEYDLDGNFLNEKIIGESGLQNYIKGFYREKDENIIVAASDQIGSPTELVIHLVKIDDSGNEIWSKRYKYGEDVRGGNIARTMDRGYLVSGGVIINGDAQWVLMKIDSLGEQEWLKEYGDVGDEDYLAYIKNSKDSNFIVSCSYEINNNGNPIARLFKINEYGEFIWQQEYQVGNNYTSFSSKFLENLDGTITAAAWTKNSSNVIESTIMKISPLGNLLWYRDYTNHPTIHQYVYGLFQTSDGGYIMTGSAIDSTQDAWIQKVDCEGCDSIQCAMQDSCMVYDCHTDSLPSAAFENQDTIRLGDTLKVTNTSKFSSGYWWDIDLAQHQSWVNPEYEFLDTGIYTVRLVAYNVDCRDTLEKQIVVIDSTTGMMENQSVNKNIKIYPNPTTGILSIEIKNKLKLLNVKITDVFGRELHSQSLSTSKSTLNLYDLSKGVYFVIITDNNKIAYKEKLVLMK